MEFQKCDVNEKKKEKKERKNEQRKANIKKERKKRKTLMLGKIEGGREGDDRG